MTCLILDTSTDQCLIALAKDGRIETQEIFYHENQLSSTLLPRIQALCPSLKILTEIAIGTGPGSYTGTRVGVAVAKSLAFGLGIPVKTFPSPLAFLPDQKGRFGVVLPTRSGQNYALVGEISEDKVTHEEPFFFTNESPAVDFLVTRLVPNLHMLIRFLSQQNHSSLESITLQYFGIP